MIRTKAKTLVLLLIVCLVSVTMYTTQPVKASGKTEGDIQAWLNNNVGQRIGTGQCFAFFHHYLNTYWGISSDQYKGFDPAAYIIDQQEPAGWQKIWGNNDFRVGDVVVWGITSYSPYGHVAVVISTNNGIQVIEQNNPDGNYWVKINPLHGTSTIRGVLRPPVYYPHYHNWVEQYEVTATCTSTGKTKYWTCGCGAVSLDAYGANIVHPDNTLTPINPNNHVYATEVRNKKESTCTEEGYTGDTYCTGCGTVIESGTSIDKIDHKYNSDGKCEMCGKTEPVNEDTATPDPSYETNPNPPSNSNPGRLTYGNNRGPSSNNRVEINRINYGTGGFSPGSFGGSGFSSGTNRFVSSGFSGTSRIGGTGYSIGSYRSGFGTSYSPATSIGIIGTGYRFNSGIGSSYTGSGFNRSFGGTSFSPGSFGGFSIRSSYGSGFNRTGFTGLSYGSFSSFNPASIGLSAIRTL